jgi:hypothetical protein
MPSHGVNEQEAFPNPLVAWIKADSGWGQFWFTLEAVAMPLLRSISAIVAGRALGLTSIATGHRWLVLLGAVTGCAGKVTSSPKADPRFRDSGAEESSSPTVDTGALSPELRQTGINLDADLGGLNSEQTASLCRALTQWHVRQAPKFCLIFVQTAVVLQPRSEQDERDTCAAELSICPNGFRDYSCAPSPPSSCSIRIRDVDACLQDDEALLNLVPSCESLTDATIVTTPPPIPVSCQKLEATCPGAVSL